MFVDDNGWIQPDQGLAKRYTQLSDAQAEVNNHFTQYAIQGTIVQLS